MRTHLANSDRLLSFQLLENFEYLIISTWAGYTPSVILSDRQTSCYALPRRLKLNGVRLRCDAIKKAHNTV